LKRENISRFEGVIYIGRGDEKEVRRKRERERARESESRGEVR